MRALLLLPLLFATALAAPDDPAKLKVKVIRDADLKPYWEEWAGVMKLMAERKISGDDALKRLRTLLQKEKVPFKKAIRHYIYGITLLDQLKRPDDAQREFEAVHEARLRVLGPDHPDTKESASFALDSLENNTAKFKRAAAEAEAAGVAASLARSRATASSAAPAAASGPPAAAPIFS